MDSKTKPVSSKESPLATQPEPDKQKSFLLTPNIPSVFSDLVVISRRNDNKTVVLHFMHRLGDEGLQAEQARVVVTLDHAVRIKDALARVLAEKTPKPEEAKR